VRLGRAQQRTLRHRWGRLRAPRLPLAALAAALTALTALAIAALVPVLGRTALAAAPPPNLTAGGQVEWVHVARVSALERQLAAAKDDLSQVVVVCYNYYYYYY